jgi:hypothetical protein
MSAGFSTIMIVGAFGEVPALAWLPPVLDDVGVSAAKG